MENILRQVKDFLCALKHRVTSRTRPLEQRLADVFLASGFLLGLSAFFVNVAIDMPFLLNAPSLFTAFLCLFVAVAFHKNNQTAVRAVLLYSAFLYFPYMYFVSGGSSTAMPIFFIMLLVYMVTTFHGWARVAVVLGIIAVNTFLLLLSHYFPQYFISYAGEFERVLDHCVSFVMAASVTAVIGASTVEIYDDERRHVVELVRQLEATNSELLALTNRDALTGIFNRRYFLDVLQKEMQIHRENELKMCVLMLDLDHFKAINDNYGHSTGDEILKLFAVSVKECLRRHDVLARYGGEEFVILLPVCSLEDGVAIAERIRRDVETLRYRRNIRFTVSIGLSCLRKNDTEISLLERADKNLYTAKRAGRNRVVAQPKTIPGERDEQASL